MARRADWLDIEGLDGLTAAIPGLGAVIAEDLMSDAKDGLIALGHEIGRVAQANAAVLTGAMRDSVEVIAADNAIIVTAGGEEAPYAVVQHQDAEVASHHFLKLAGDIEGGAWRVPRIRDPIKRARAQRKFARSARRLA